MFKTIGQVLDHEMKFSEFLGVLILIGIPYFLVGVAWTLTHTAHLDNVHNNVDKVVSFLGSIVCWPVLLISNVTMT
ncbi:hypothetical protein BN970_03502 [Mycolicibacterium conceptionense]|uniref:Uncharacterized protein n=1 Tax=Mycolicibacterium conceptionense TaxID=451644 RepID=A0A0U1DHN2_9MYCO|nr:hypothetical protein [Mycolicibacterium conceptionense]ORV24623.1 hypothetical protein AWB98_20455 [Mycolicibacterium conceptionense]CQD16462.1 hypothetical protein BN970_03502 [Mycolicibacterium conceptionense]